MILLLICGILFFLYSLLVIYYWHGWISIPDFEPAENDPALTVSVIVPARNEEENIGSLLKALKQQTYPPDRVEIIVVDDHSADKTADIVKGFPGVKLISLRQEGINSYKKKAVETGIAAATGEMIVTTDADCIPPVNWLKTLAAFAGQQKAVFVVAPVMMNGDSSVLQIFQTMDFMILQVITGAVVYKKQLSMCNGANIAYPKKIFEETGGFHGIDQVASGDDMLLMYKIWKQYPHGVYYLKSKEAIVSTRPMLTWRYFLNQRIRWASKANKYDDKRFLPVLWLVYLFNLSLLVLLLAGFWNPCYWLYFFIFWGAKTVAELPLLWAATGFFNKRWLLKLFFFFQPLHILYTILAGSFGQFGKYEWKGRRVS